MKQTIELKNCKIFIDDQVVKITFNDIDDVDKLYDVLAVSSNTILIDYKIVEDE